jgi:Fe-S oxidoreductase
LAGIPVVAEAVNAVNSSKLGRKLLEKTLGVDVEAPVPKYHSRSARSRLKDHVGRAAEPSPAAGTQGRVAVFATCYGNRNHPGLVEDLVAVLEHNEIGVALVGRERCCGMPKFELGDLKAIERLKDANIDELDRYARDGWDLTAVVPSCVLMFKQELPLLFPEDERVQRVRDAFFDPFEYLMLRHRDGKLRTKFATSLGKISYQVPCHLRVQNVGLKTRDLLQLVPGTAVQAIERCSGHDGTYGVRQKTYALSRKIAKPVESRVQQIAPAHFASDCPMAASHIAHGLNDDPRAESPISLLRQAYGI